MLGSVYGGERPKPELHSMKHAIRSLALVTALGAGFLAMAQPPYSVTITGTISGCNANSYVTIATLAATQPAIDIDVPVLPPSCSFTITLNMASQGGGFTISTPCNGAIQSQVVQYQVPPAQDSTAVSVLFNCGSTAPDCLGVPGGSAQPGTACTTVNNEPGVFNSNCDCIPFASACTACFTVSQDSSGTFTPFEADFISCSSSVGGTYTLNWQMPDGTGPTGNTTSFSFPGPGMYGVGLWMVGNSNNCTSYMWDSVYVDESGTVTLQSNLVYDCLQVINGPNMPGTACTNPATGETGTWSADCTCITNSTGCQAGFWVIQAYEVDSLNPNGGATPIPYELWVWNLSTGTSPFQFLWSFGDGSSSTDPYPTHVYGSSGPYNLCLTLTDGAGCTSIHCDSVSIDGDGFYEGLAPQQGEARNGFTIRVQNQLPAAVPEQRFEDSRMWPNPVTEELNMSFRSTVGGNVPLSIIDLNGRVMHQGNLAFVRGDNRINLSAAHLVPGMYVLRVGDDDQALNIRFIKQ